MAKYNQIQNNFISGEISPLLQERSDLADYNNSASRLQNFIVMPQGGITRRSGSIHMGDITAICNDIDVGRGGLMVGGTLQNTAIFPFTINNEEMLLVLRKQYYVALGPVDVWGINSYVLSANDRDNYFNSITGSPYDPVSTGKGCRTLISAYNFNGTHTSDNMFREIGELGILSKANLDTIFENTFHFAQTGDLIFLTSSTGLMPPIYFWKHRTVSPGIPTVYFGTFQPGSLDAYYAQFQALWSQRPAAQPPGLERHTSFPSQAPNISPITFAPSVIVAGNTGLITASASYFDGTTDDWKGKIIWINPTKTGAFLVLSRTSATVLSVLCLKPANATTAVTDWSISQWGGKHGFPKSVCIYQQRLVFGGNNGFVDTIWNSYVGQLFRFFQYKYTDDAVPYSDAYPFSFFQGSGAASGIQWLATSDVIEVGAGNQEYTVKGYGSGVYSPSSFEIKTQTSRGSSNTMPARSDNITFFASKDGKKVLGFNKVYQTGEYDVADLGVQGRYITETEFDLDHELFFDENSFIKKIVVSRIESIVWVLINKPVLSYDYNTSTSTYSEKFKSSLIGLSYNSSGKVVSWHRHQFEDDGAIGYGLYSDLDEPKNLFGPYIEDICVLEDKINGYSKLMLLTQRRNRNSFGLFIGRNDALECIRNNAPRNKFFVNLKTPEVSHYMSNFLDNAYFYWDPDQPAITNFSAYPAAQFANNLAGSIVGIGVKADGTLVQEDDILVNASGEFSTTNAFVCLMIGKKFKSIMTTNRVNSGALFGSAQGLNKRSNEADIRLFKSAGGNFTHQKNLTDFTPMPYPPEKSSILYTGNCRAFLRNSPDEDTITIFTDDIYPFTLLSLIQEGVLYDS